MLLTTYSDIVSHLLDYGKGSASEGSTLLRFCKRAANDGLRELTNVHPWTFYRSVGTFNTSDPYNTGTVTYDHTGGTYERQLTLADGTWPTWAMYGTVVINNKAYDIATRESDSVVTLMPNSNPGTDITDDTEYMLYRDAYPVPVDMISVERMFIAEPRYELVYMTPQVWLEQREVIPYPNIVTAFTIISDQNYEGVNGFRMSCAPSTSQKMDFIYRRRPKALRVYSESAGTVSISAASDQITGSGTAFTADMVGSAIRFSSNGSNAPTGDDGDYPAKYERVIRAVTSSTVAYLDDSIPENLSGVKYVISDVVDINPQVMLNAYKRTCEKILEITRMGDNIDFVTAMWQQELLMARTADRSYVGGGVATGGLEGLSNGTNARPFGYVRGS